MLMLIIIISLLFPFCVIVKSDGLCNKPSDFHDDAWFEVDEYD